MYIFLCEDSIDGIFTGVYDAWASRLGHHNVALTTHAPDNYSLFDEYISVPCDLDKSAKVARTLHSRMGDETYQEICQAASALEPNHKRKLIKRTQSIKRLSLPCRCRMPARRSIIWGTPMSTAHFTFPSAPVTRLTTFWVSCVFRN